ncbi:ATP-binding protein [Salinicola sp. RZ23]|uniref:ATP-binding protein n=1 Tax=Salinicola sp. RZ23 TaxID=1949087 RepID=UPI000DA18A5E|nr:ATP-binding protein [Salinicola sp. RZ23]
MLSRWLTRLALILVIGVLLLSGRHLWQLEQARGQRVPEHLGTMGRVLVPTLTEALRDEDHATIHRLLVQLSNDPDIRNVTLRNDDGSEADCSGEAPGPPPRPLDAGAGGWHAESAQRWLLPIDWLTPAQLPQRLWLDIQLSPDAVDTDGRSLYHILTMSLSSLCLLLLLGAGVARRRHATPLHPAADRRDGKPGDPYFGETDPGETAPGETDPGETDPGTIGPGGTAPALPTETNGPTPRPDAASPSTRPDAASSPAWPDTAKEISDLAYVSHELRAPLSGVLGLCRLLENSPLDARQREWLRHIHLASNGLLDTVDHVLGDERRRQVETTFDIADLLWEVNCLQTPLAQARGITLLGMVYDEVPPRLVGQPVALRQLLTNLISNAVKYGAAGDVVTRITLAGRDGERVRLTISVKDAGCAEGSDREQLRRALAAPAETAGSGSGLAVCRRLTREMGGELRLGNDGRRGNSVIASVTLGACEPFSRPAEFDLGQARIGLYQRHTRLDHLLAYALKRWSARAQPITHADALANGDEPPALMLIGLDQQDLEPAASAAWQRRFDAMRTPCLLVVNAEPTQPLPWHLPAGSSVLRLPISRYLLGRTLAGMLDAAGRQASSDQPRILVVDDDELSQHYLDALIPIVGASSLVAGSAEAALTLAAGHAIDLVLMDLRLPDASGAATIARLRALGGRWTHLPIVAMSASPGAELPEEGPGGCQQLLTKPIDERQLRSLLMRYLPGVSEPTGEPELAVVDPDLALHLSGGREALADELLTLLLAELPHHRLKLAQAWQAADAEALSDAVHQLGGGCRYCGVPALSAACNALETRLQQAPLADCRREWIQLTHACDQLAAWAERHATGVTPPR